jgi:23S rRNA (adenine2503-C2)-methyltransferase
MEMRKEVFARLFPSAPGFRWRQFEAGLFDGEQTSFASMTALPGDMRASLVAGVPFLTVKEAAVLRSYHGDTEKAILELSDGARIETVLMRNARGYRTICVSSQVGCAMACTFCATGKMGFSRNLSEDEIIDQYRFWMYRLAVMGDEKERVSNIVFMGMGEPLANYDAVKASIRTILSHTDIGPTKITVSTVGLVPMLEQLLNDPEWTPVRLAISLHSANAKLRKEMMPTSYPEFLQKLSTWTKKYFKKFPEARRHLTLEYILLEGVNDGEASALELAKFSNGIGKVKVNLIPYNTTASAYRKSDEDHVTRFQEILQERGVDVTRRRAMGDDIAAACGQLITEKSRIKN